MDKAIILRRGDKITINRAIPEAVDYIENVIKTVEEDVAAADIAMQVRDWPEVESFLGGVADLPPKKEKIVLSRNKEIYKEAKTASKGEVNGISRADAVKRAIKGVSKQGALNSKQVAASAGLTVSEVSEPLVRLTKTGKIGRIKDKPHRYFDIKYAEIKDRHVSEAGGKIACAMRFDKKISRDECVPNPNAKECLSCPWGKEQSAA